MRQDCTLFLSWPVPTQGSQTGTLHFVSEYVFRTNSLLLWKGLSLLPGLLHLPIFVCPSPLLPHFSNSLYIPRQLHYQSLAVTWNSLSTLLDPKHWALAQRSATGQVCYAPNGHPFRSFHKEKFGASNKTEFKKYRDKNAAQSGEFNNHNVQWCSFFFKFKCLIVYLALHPPMKLEVIHNLPPCVWYINTINMTNG